jgi:hypothetical protein
MDKNGSVELCELVRIFYVLSIMVIFVECSRSMKTSGDIALFQGAWDGTDSALIVLELIRGL